MKGHFEKGIDFGSLDPDATSQNYYLEVIPLDISASSKKFGVDSAMGLMEVENARSASMAKEEKAEKKKDDGKCPNCDKDITLDEIRKICVDKKGNCLIKDDSMIKAALPYLNKYRQKVKINTCVSKAHFLAQISQESKFYQFQERFKYSNSERMRGLFESYFKQFGSIENQKIEAKRLSDLSHDSKNWEEVANAIYGPTHPIGKNSGHGKTDGWRYSGKGFKQITWKDNYEKLQIYVKNNFGLDVQWLDGDNPYKLKTNPKDAMISALAYWGKNNISSLANESSNEAVKKVTKRINENIEGLEERIRYFNKAVEVLKVESCTPGKISNYNEKGTVVVISGVSRKYGDKKDGEGKQWAVYKIKVYKNLSLETYKKDKKENKLPSPDYESFVARDAANASERSKKRYGSSNECPPNEYYLNKGLSNQKYHIYIADNEGIGESSISGVDGWRGGIAIHGGWPSGAEGCITTHTSGYGNRTRKQAINPLVKNLIENMPDFDNNNDDKPVRLIIEERKVSKETGNWLGIID